MLYYRSLLICTNKKFMNEQTSWGVGQIERILSKYNTCTTTCAPFRISNIDLL